MTADSDTLGPMAPEEDPLEEQRASEATSWFLRLTEPDVAEAERKAFRHWLAGDPKRRQTFNEISRLWSDLETPAAILAEGQWYRPASKGQTRAVVSVALKAASIGLVVGLSAFLTLWRDAGLIDRMQADYATRPGERREITLAEGSRLYLDGDTALDVSLEPHNRKIRLLRGRAWFEVTPDKTAPFTVTMNDVDVRVLGTAFAVDWDKDEIDVVVEHGLVGVSGPQDSVEVPGGEQVQVSQGRVKAAIKADMDVAFAWRRGLIILHQAPLGRVIDELERMRPGRVMVTDARLRQLTISGVFRVDDPDSIVEALRSALELRTFSVPGLATLIYR